jgi:hypothetical protein
VLVRENELQGHLVQIWAFTYICTHCMYPSKQIAKNKDTSKKHTCTVPYVLKVQSNENKGWPKVQFKSNQNDKLSCRQVYFCSFKWT